MSTRWCWLPSVKNKTPNPLSETYFPWSFRCDPRGYWTEIFCLFELCLDTSLCESTFIYCPGNWRDIFNIVFHALWLSKFSYTTSLDFLSPLWRHYWCDCKLLLPLSRFSRVRLCATPWTAAYQASPSMGFSRQEHWSGLPFPSPVTAKGKYKLKNPHDRPLSFI